MGEVAVEWQLGSQDGLVGVRKQAGTGLNKVTNELLHASVFGTISMSLSDLRST
jgi:hypothetical protein